MSVDVFKAGMADSFQDGGRFGYQHLGINPGGAMDVMAMNVANALVGNDLNEAVLELCFPAASLGFNKSCLMALSGANFTAEINGISILINQTIAVPAGSELKFTKAEQGVFCYLAIRGGFNLEEWLGSFSTNVKAHKGGCNGRLLQTRDEIEIRKNENHGTLKIFPGRVNVSEWYGDANVIRMLKGNEFEWLDEKSKAQLMENSFTVTSIRDRMGYRLAGEGLTTRGEELISTAASFGTVQILPDGQLIVLMADHQTTGGYPRVGQVISADRSKLVQLKVGERIFFREVGIEEAEDLMISQQKMLKQIQVTCAVRLKENLDA